MPSGSAWLYRGHVMLSVCAWWYMTCYQVCVVIQGRVPRCLRVHDCMRTHAKPSGCAWSYRAHVAHCWVCMVLWGHSHAVRVCMDMCDMLLGAHGHTGTCAMLLGYAWPYGDTLA